MPPLFVLQLPTEPHPIVHRIVAVDMDADGGGRGGYLTKGDNNARDDEGLYAAAGLVRVGPEHIVGKVVGRVPGLGRLRHLFFGRP